MTERLKTIVCGGCDLYGGLLAHVDVAKNRVVRITANPDHPLVPNSICRIGMRGMDFVSHPDRRHARDSRVWHYHGKWANEWRQVRLLWLVAPTRNSATHRPAQWRMHARER